MYQFGTRFLDRVFHLLLDIGSLLDAIPISIGGQNTDRQQTAFIALPIATVSCNGYTLGHLYNTIQRIYPGQCQHLDRLHQ
jgi:hypothetical protein